MNSLNGTRLSALPVLYHWIFADKAHAIVIAGVKKGEKELYLIDYNAKTIKSIKKLTGLSSVWGAKIMEGKLFVYTGDTDCFGYYSYDLISKEKHCIYKNMAVYTEGTKHMDCVNFMGGRYDLVKMGDMIYLGDEMNGQLRKIEGLTKKFMNGLINETGDKIIISRYEDGN